MADNLIVGNKNPEIRTSASEVPKDSPPSPGKPTLDNNTALTAIGGKEPQPEPSQDTQGVQTPSNAPAELKTQPEKQKTEFDKKVGEMDAAAAKLKESAAKLTAQETKLAEAKKMQAEGERTLATETNKLKEEGAKESAAAKAELTKMEGMVGKGNPALKEVLGAVPAGLTKADAKEVIDRGIKKLAPDIAKNIVDPAKKPEDMTVSEQKRVDDYSRRFRGDAPAGKVLEGIQAREKIVDQQQIERDKAVKGTIDNLVSKLPEGDRKSTTDSYNKGLKALDQSGTTEEQKINIKNALGAKPGSQIRSPKGEIYDVVGHKDGVVTLRGEDSDLGGTVEKKVSYEKFRSSLSADGMPLAGIHEKTFGSNDDYKPNSSTGSEPKTAPKNPVAPAIAPATPKEAAPAKAPAPAATSPIASERTRPEGVPADFEFHPTSMAPKGTEPKYIDTTGSSPGYWSPTAKITPELPLTGNAVGATSKDAAPAPAPAPASTPTAVPAVPESVPQTAAPRKNNRFIPTDSNTARGFEPMEAAQSTRSVPEKSSNPPSVPAQTPSASSEEPENADFTTRPKSIGTSGPITKFGKDGFRDSNGNQYTPLGKGNYLMNGNVYRTFENRNPVTQKLDEVLMDFNEDATREYYKNKKA